MMTWPMNFLFDDVMEHMMSLVEVENLDMPYDFLLTYLRILTKVYHYNSHDLMRLSQLHLNLAVVYHLQLHLKAGQESHVPQLQDGNSKNQIVLEDE